jgi:hypothetical protein
MVVTFVTSSDPKETAKILDSRRLGKQRVEASQIIKALLENGKGWKNHPATKAWVGHIDALKDYCNVMILEWVSRGKNNTMKLYDDFPENPTYPPWYSNERIQLSHQARLIQKDPVFYKKVFNPPDIYLHRGYIWPSKWSLEEINSLPIERLTEEFVEIKICMATKKSGDKCNNKTSNGDYCGVHRGQNKKSNQVCSSTCKNGSPCKNKRKFEDKCGVHKLKN